MSYFFGAPRSEVWQLDTQSGQQRCLYTLPPSDRDVPGKGITGLTWLNNTQLLACDFNRLLLLNRIDGEIIKEYADDQFNDLHHVHVQGEYIYVANTGRDSIDVLDHQLQRLERLDGLSATDWSQRYHGDYAIRGAYYDRPDSGLPFYKRKVPDSWHFNHVLRDTRVANGRIVATSFGRKQLVDARTLEPLSSVLPDAPHDGLIADDSIWITTVTGKIYRAPLTLPFAFECVLDLFAQAPKAGWCRGLLICENTLYIGITSIYEKSSRTAWLDRPLNETASGIYCVDLATLTLIDFHDFTTVDGRRIFTVIDDHCLL
tara:strand:+ start:1755 stop:2705 length:951 start_codon:yes stop_codon:yes gene_type:complete